MNNHLVLVDTIGHQIWHRNGNAYRCSKYVSHFCHARLNYVDGEYVVIGEHSHDPLTNEVRVNEMRAFAQERAVHEAAPLHEIFRHAEERYFISTIRVLNLLFIIFFLLSIRFPDARVDFGGMRRGLDRARRRNNPGDPANAREADQAFTRYPRLRYVKYVRSDILKFFYN